MKYLPFVFLWLPSIAAAQQLPVDSTQFYTVIQSLQSDNAALLERQQQLEAQVSEQGLFLRSELQTMREEILDFRETTQTDTIIANALRLMGFVGFGFILFLAQSLFKARSEISKLKQDANDLRDQIAELENEGKQRLKKEFDVFIEDVIRQNEALALKKVHNHLEEHQDAFNEFLELNTLDYWARHGCDILVLCRDGLGGEDQKHMSTLLESWKFDVDNITYQDLNDHPIEGSFDLVVIVDHDNDVNIDPELLNKHFEATPHFPYIVYVNNHIDRRLLRDEHIDILNFANSQSTLLTWMMSVLRHHLLMDNLTSPRTGASSE